MKALPGPKVTLFFGSSLYYLNACACQDDYSALYSSRGCGCCNLSFIRSTLFEVAVHRQQATPSVGCLLRTSSNHATIPFWGIYSSTCILVLVVLPINASTNARGSDAVLFVLGMFVSGIKHTLLLLYMTTAMYQVRSYISMCSVQVYLYPRGILGGVPNLPNVGYRSGTEVISILPNCRVPISSSYRTIPNCSVGY